MKYALDKSKHKTLLEYLPLFKISLINILNADALIG